MFKVGDEIIVLHKKSERLPFGSMWTVVSLPGKSIIYLRDEYEYTDKFTVQTIAHHVSKGSYLHVRLH